MPESEPRPSVVLHGFEGGIVKSANTALRLGQVVLENLVGQRRLARCLPLQAQDRGDRWSLSGAGGDGSSECRIDIGKSDAAVLPHGVPKPPEILSNATTAEKFAAILAESAGDGVGVDRQWPFTVTDRGDTWVVRGGRHVRSAIEGPGPFHLEIRKRDARVLDIWFEWNLHTPPEVDELLRATKK